MRNTELENERERLIANFPDRLKQASKSWTQEEKKAAIATNVLQIGSHGDRLLSSVEGYDAWRFDNFSLITIVDILFPG